MDARRKHIIVPVLILGAAGFVFFFIIAVFNDDPRGHMAARCTFGYYGSLSPPSYFYCNREGHQNV